MLINGKRALAHVQLVHDITPITGADNIELIHVLGWTLIAKKGEFKDGDKCIYIEIDSKVDENDERFSFLQSKHYKVKTYKLNKFGVVSQGLALPLSLFPELGDLDINTDITNTLHITYAVDEDNVRKSNVDSMTSLKNKKPKLFKNPFVKWLMRFKFGRWLILKLFGKKKNDSFPTHLCSKTDEERIENVPFYLGTGPYYYSEKLDGSSATYAMERKGPNKFEFYVCSRNVRFLNSKEDCFYKENIYWEQAIKYDIEFKLKTYLRSSKHKSIVIQGEIVGPSVQKKTYGLKERDFFVFNIIDDGVRYNTPAMEKIASALSLRTVPILGLIDELPETMEEIKQLAEGKSMIGDCNREGLVYRKINGESAFKNVSLSYLLEKKGKE